MTTAVITSAWDSSLHTAHTISPEWGSRKYIFANTDSLSERAVKVLGEDGVSRFNEFKKYVAGWDSGHGKRLSKRSVAVLNAFIHEMPTIQAEPSLFFTRAGNLQLGWEDSSHQILEFEFFPNKIEFFLESEDSEGEIPLDSFEIKSLAERAARL